MNFVLKNHPSLSAPTRAMRSRDIVRQAINDGKPLPLQVMLEAMWAFRLLAIAARASGDDAEEDGLWAKTLDAASRAAPYVHPKLATEAVDSGPNSEEGRANSAWAIYNALEGRTDEDIHRAYQALIKGEDIQGTVIENG